MKSVVTVLRQFQIAFPGCNPPSSSSVWHWWAQDGTPAQQLIAVQDRLPEIFADRVIALHLPIEWPPHSPNLTPCYYFLLALPSGQSILKFTLHVRTPFFYTPCSWSTEIPGDMHAQGHLCETAETEGTHQGWLS